MPVWGRVGGLAWVFEGAGNHITVLDGIGRFGSSEFFVLDGRELRVVLPIREGRARVVCA